MFDSGVFIDGNWIADGHFFRWVEKVSSVKFADAFKGYEQAATVEMAIVSTKFVYDGDLVCVLLSGGDFYHYPVQVRLLEAVGVELNEDVYAFKLNPETRMIFIYDEDGGLMGGVMPLGVRNDNQPT